MTEIYYCNTNDISLKENCLNTLPNSRREKIERLVHLKDKKASLCAGLLIKKFVTDSELTLGVHGKPYAENGSFFNISHSGDYVVIALSDCEVGCDIEVFKDLNYERTGKIVFHENELQKLGNVKDKRAFFYELWTRKEAFIKCIGEGFGFKTSSLDLSSFPDKLLYGGRTFFFKKYMLSDAEIMLCTEDKALPEIIKKIDTEVLL